ncbi:MAG TPA: M48 family metallopeptidase, partial [Kofleriaceae bacterium]
SATRGAGAGTARERSLRRLYRGVLLLCGVYFYLSIPILLLMIVAAGGGAIYAFLAMGVIPIKLVLIIAIVVIATIGAILRGLFVRVAPASFGHRVDLDRQPRLRALLDEVAGKVGTRPVDAVYLTPGTDMGVTERAGLWSSMRDSRVQRNLIMGIGLFDGMTQLQLRSVLAHEYGHFRNADTAGGGFALAVRRSLFAIIIRLARSGAAGAYNPVWWFLRAYHRIYLGVSQGASRLQEVLADRWAIEAYGTAAFVAGYRHVVSRSVQFDHQVDATIKEVVDAHRPLPNLYQYRPQSGDAAERDVADAIHKEMTRAPTAYDSHPSPQQRIDGAQALAVEREAQPDDDASIWALFDDRDEIERTMTAEVRARIFASHGIDIAGAEQAAAGPASDGPR